MKFHVQELRPEVLAFALLMEARLREKDEDKGASWKQRPTDTFTGSICIKSQMLDRDVRLIGDRTKASANAVDLANYCMFIADVSGALDNEIEALAAEQGFGLVDHQEDTSGNGGPGWAALDQVQMS